MCIPFVYATPAYTILADRKGSWAIATLSGMKKIVGFPAFPERMIALAA